MIRALIVFASLAAFMQSGGGLRCQTSRAPFAIQVCVPDGTVAAAGAFVEVTAAYRSLGIRELVAFNNSLKAVTSRGDLPASGPVRIALGDVVASGVNQMSVSARASRGGRAEVNFELRIR